MSADFFHKKSKSTYVISHNVSTYLQGWPMIITFNINFLLFHLWQKYAGAFG